MVRCSSSSLNTAELTSEESEDTSSLDVKSKSRPTGNSTSKGWGGRRALWPGWKCDGEEGDLHSLFHF